MTKLSIITINKNNALGLKKTCLSVACQTYSNFEWIVIDGASNDNSVEIIKEYAYKMTFWISEPDSGVYNAMNKGVKKANGEYILFLNSGDFLLFPWTLENVLAEINETKNADVYYSDAVTDNYQIMKYPREITIDFWKQTTLNHQNCLISNRLFSHQLFSEKYKIVSDWYFFITEFIYHNISFVRINTNIAMYDTTGMSSIQSTNNESERQMILKELNLEVKNKLNFNFPKKVIKYLLPYGIVILCVFIKKRLKRNVISV